MSIKYKRVELKPSPGGRKIVNVSSEDIAGGRGQAEAEGGERPLMCPRDKGGQCLWWRKQVSTQMVPGGVERADECFSSSSLLKGSVLGTQYLQHSTM